MSKQNYQYCVTYSRSRSIERRADALALAQQEETRSELRDYGYKCLGGFGDPEFAAPYCGWLEPRAGWQLALDAASKIAEAKGECTVIVLRSDGIGSGDPFLPQADLLDAKDGVSIRLAGFDLRSHASSTSLRKAQKRFERFKVIERKNCRVSIISAKRGKCEHELMLKPDYRKRLVRAYFVNHSDEPLTLQIQKSRRSLSPGSEWLAGTDWCELEVPAQSAHWLDTFFQGEADPSAHRWRFRVGHGRQRRVGNVIVTPHDLSRATLPISWYPYESEALRKTDYKWDGLPAIETTQLHLRQWRKGDYKAFGKACNTPAVMHFLGGVQPAWELREDVSFFAELGRSGPTFWALERRSDSALMGFSGVIKVDDEGSPVEGEWEIGWRLGEQFQGQGYAYEAAAAVLSNLFEVWHVGRVVSRIDAHNLASIAVAMKLGFVENRALRDATDEGGRVLHVYEMSEKEYWRTSRASVAVE